LQVVLLPWVRVVRLLAEARARQVLVEVSCLEALLAWEARWPAVEAAALRQALRAQSTVCRRLLRMRVEERTQL
jgi:hypothetical protein